MSDWRLTNKEGTLVWTSPALPGGGQSLHITLSPTLMLACKNKGDTIPVNYIKLPDVTRVSASTPTSIQLDRRTGSSVLLVCNDGPQEAAAWLQAIQRAVGGGGSLGGGTSPRAGSAPGKSVAPSPGPSASGPDSAPSAASGGAPTTTTATAKPVDPQMSGIANALRTDLRDRPIADPTAAPTTPRRDLGAASNNINNSSGISVPAPGSVVPLPMVAASGSGTGGTPQASPNGSNFNMNANFNNNNNTNTGSQSPGPTSPTTNYNLNAQQLPQQQPLQQSGQFGQPQQQSGQFGQPQQSGQFGQPQQSGQFGQPQQSGQFGQHGGAVGNSSTAQLVGGRSIVNNNNQPQPHFQELDPQQLLQQPSTSSTPASGLTPLATYGGGGIKNPSLAAAAAVGGGGGAHPVATTTTNKQQFEVVTPGQPGSVIRPVVAPVLGTAGVGAGSGFGAGGNMNNNNMMMQTPMGVSRINDPAGSVSTPRSGNGGGGAAAVAGGGAWSGSGASSASASAAAGAGGGGGGVGGGNNSINNNNMTTASAAAALSTAPGRSALSSIVDSLPDGSLVAAARRRGMMVEIPATQSVNRSIAPNASALWKEWRDPNGTLYVLHEPTGTLQRLVPGDDTFQTYATDEQIVANKGQMPHTDRIPRHQPGDPTLDMDTMSVSNLHHYGQVGAAMSGNTPLPPIPAAGLMREMVVQVPRGQFSPSRRVQAEPLAVPRVADAGYHGKRIHRFTLHGSDDPRVAVVEHQVQSLDTEGILWDPRTRELIDSKNGGGRGGNDAESQRQLQMRSLALNQQWEHVKRILMQGRYFKKHAFRKSNASAYRYVFLSADNQWVCSVPTSDVMVKVQGEDGETFMGPEAQQYFPADTKAMSVNGIEAIVLASEEERLRYRKNEMDLDSTFLIVGRSHMLILECNSPQEARFFADSWNYYLFYSKPEKPKPTPQMMAPVTFGTRGGIAW